MKRILCTLLSTAMLFTGLSACKKGGDVSSAKDSPAGTVYRAKRNTVSGAPDETDGYILQDGRLYFRGTDRQGETENGWEKVFYSLNSCGIEGNDLKSVPLNSGDTNISKFDIDSNGNAVFIESDYVSEKPVYRLKRITQDGTVIEEKDITSVISEHASEYFYPESVILDTSGKIVIYCYFQIIVTDSQCNYLFDIPHEYGIEKLVRSADGELYAKVGSENSYCDFHKLDMEKGALGDNIDIVQGYEFSYKIEPYSGSGDTDIFLDDGSSLYTFDIESGRKTELFNYVNSDISGQEISSIFPLEDGVFLGAGRSYMGNNLLLSKIQPADPSALSQRTEITVAGSEYSISSMLEYQAIKFNTENEKYRVVIKKFGGEDYVQKLNNEMTAGRIPDILITDSATPFDSYAAKGLFADLYEFIDKDSEINRSDFLPNILTAMETDGKLYRFADSFKILTVVGKTEIFGKEKGITFDRLNEIMKGFPQGTEIFAGTTKGDILDHAMELCGGSFIDYKKGTCSFDSEDFINILKFADGFLDNTDDFFSDDFWDRYNTMYKDDEALMIITYITDFCSIFYPEHNNFYKEVTAVGFPSISGYGSAFNIDSGYAISAKSKNQEGAWEFIRCTLTEDYQDGIDDLPVRKTSLEKKALRNMKEFDRDAVRMTTIGGMTIGVNSANSDELPKQADIDKVMDVINSTTQISSYNDIVRNIVSEEAGAFFSGQKSAEEVTKIIQDRVQNYLNEIS